jgi:hypothetical protein
MTQFLPKLNAATFRTTMPGFNRMQMGFTFKLRFDRLRELAMIPF